MAWSLCRTFTLDEFALLMAGIDPSQIEGGVNEAYQLGWHKAVEAKTWLRLITETAQLKEFDINECMPVAYDEETGEYVRISASQLTPEWTLHPGRTKVSRAALQRWLLESGYELPDFLSNGLPAAQPQQDTTAQPEPAPAEIPAHLLEIQKLLDGEHEHKAEELALAINAWLGVSRLYSQGLQSAPSPNKEAVAWLDDNAPEVGPTKRDRIATTVNWDKSGGNKTGSRKSDI